MRKDFKIFVFASILGGIVWVGTGAAFMLLNNGFAISAISGFFAAAGLSVFFYMSRASEKLKVKSRVFVLISSIALLLYFFLIMRHLLSITSGEVALTSALLILVCLIFCSAEIAVLSSGSCQKAD